MNINLNYEMKLHGVEMASKVIIKMCNTNFSQKAKVTNMRMNGILPR